MKIADLDGIDIMTKQTSSHPLQFCSHWEKKNIENFPLIVLVLWKVFPCTISTNFTQPDWYS